MYKDGLFYYFSYRQERKRGKKRRIRRENNGREGWNGAGVREGGGGEGLTAINFAKIGAYAVAGRQSNPSSAHYPPNAEMGVRLDIESSHEKRRAAGGDSSRGSRLYFLQLSS